MADEVTIAVEHSTGRVIIRCDTAAFERMLDAVCRVGDVSLPVTIPPVAPREIAVMLSATAPPPSVGWLRHAMAVVICVFLLAGPIGLYALVTWFLQ